MGVLVLDVGTGQGCKEVQECVSIDHVSGQDGGNGAYNGGRWRQRWYSGNWHNNNGQGKVFDGDVFIAGKGKEWPTLDDIGGVVGDGGDGTRVLVDEMVIGRGVVFVVNDGGVGKFWDGEDEIVKLLAV